MTTCTWIYYWRFLTGTIGVLFLAGQLSAQRDFQFGYYVNNDGDSIQALIRKPSDEKTPDQIQVFDPGIGVFVTLPMSQVQSFGVPNTYRFERHRVDIDQSSQRRRELSNHPFPQWEREIVFLKVIVDGPGSLYHLNDGKGERYFYTREDSPVEQLEFKDYMDRRDKVSSYRRFEQQLLEDVNCSGTHLLGVKKLKYSRYPLENYFRKFNDCLDRPYRIYREENKQIFSIRLTPGLVVEDMRMYYESDQFHYGTTLSASLGLEFEMMLPLKERTWSILAESRFQSFSSELPNNQTSAIKYNFIELPVGIRYYFKTHQRVSPFLNAHFVPDLSFTFAESGFAGKNLAPGSNYCVGGGLNWGWLSTEIRYYSSRDVVAEYSNMASTFHRIEIILGVSVL